MKIIIWVMSVFVCLFFINDPVSALPVSDSDLWQGATITGASSTHRATGNNHNGLFDGDQGGYGYETGNALFADGFARDTTHWVEWQTSADVTVKSINVIAYHDFDGRTINDRGFSEFTFFYDAGSGWESFYSWTYSDPNADLHYGGGPSYQFTPDPHDMARSYLELTEDISMPVTAAKFRAEFVQFNVGGPRIVELDAFDTVHTVPEPSIWLLFGLSILTLLKWPGNRRRC